MIHIRKPHHEPIVAPERLDVDAGLLADARRGGHGPWRVDAPAARREHADPPVAELIADPLDDDRRGIGQGAGGGDLVAEVLQQVLGGACIEIVLAREPIDGGRRRHANEVAHQRADGEPEFQRPSRPVALPERHFSRLARSRRDEHPVVRDLLDAPRGGAEDEGLADLRLEDHFLVELADASGARAGAEEEDAVEPAIGNRAAVRDRDALRPVARDDRTRDPIPCDARAQLGELVGRVAAGQHVEDAVEGGASELRKRGGAPERREQLVDVPRVHRGHRHDLLRDDVERVAGVARRFDGAVVHGLRDRRRRDEVAAELREDDALAHRVDLMSGTADALEAAGH